MTARHTEITRRDAVRRERKPYSPPVLTEFGSVGMLTQSGSGDMTEFGITYMGVRYCGPLTSRQMC